MVSHGSSKVEVKTDGHGKDAVEPVDCGPGGSGTVKVGTGGTFKELVVPERTEVRKLPESREPEPLTNTTSLKTRRDKRFLSCEHSAGIINGNNNAFVTECMQACGRKRGRES